MQFSVVFEKINEKTFPEGFYYVHIPSLGLTTHGLGIDGAKNAAKDLIKIWIEEKTEQGEEIKEESDVFYSKIEI
jgi:predicted RNase H-like HicB family nuclease